MMSSKLANGVATFRVGNGVVSFFCRNLVGVVRSSKDDGPGRMISSTERLGISVKE